MPFPQLLPGLDECLHLSGTGKTVVDQPAILIRLLVKLTNRRHAEVREVVTEFFEVLPAQNLPLLAIRTAGHLDVMPAVAAPQLAEAERLCVQSCEKNSGSVSA